MKVKGFCEPLRVLAGGAGLSTQLGGCGFLVGISSRASGLCSPCPAGSRQTPPLPQRLVLWGLLAVECPSAKPPCPASKQGAEVGAGAQREARSSTGGAASQGQRWQSCLDSRLLSRTLKQTDAQPDPPTPEEPHQAWRAGRFSPKTPNPPFTFSRSLGLSYLSSSPGGDVILRRAQTSGAVGPACRRSPRQPV